MLDMTIATGYSDRTAPLHSGRIQPEGLSVNWLALNAEQIFWRMLRHGEFDASELSLAGYSVRHEERPDDLVGIPVFPSRAFRHDCIYINADAGIRTPKDLVGRRVGVPDYRMTAAVWARGALSDDYDVAATAMEWVQGGLEQAGRRPIEETKLRGVTVETAAEGETLAKMLERGELHALITPRTPSTYIPGGAVRRLFDDPWTVARDYYKRTGIFPIMHLVAVKRPLVDANPWLPQTLATAFQSAKELAEHNLQWPTGTLPVALPFLSQHVHETIELMGVDYWPYGVEANRTTLETFFRFAHEQGLIGSVPSLEGFFAPSTQHVSRI